MGYQWGMEVYLWNVRHTAMKPTSELETPGQILIPSWQLRQRAASLKYTSISMSLLHQIFLSQKIWLYNLGISTYTFKQCWSTENLCWKNTSNFWQSSWILFSKHVITFPPLGIFHAVPAILNILHKLLSFVKIHLSPLKYLLSPYHFWENCFHIPPVIQR